MMFYIIYSQILPSLPPSFMFFIFFKKEKRKEPLKAMESNLCWPITPEHGVCPGVWLTCPGSHHGRKLTLTFPAVISCK